MANNKGTARQWEKNAAFERLDAIPLDQLRGVSWTRAACLAQTTTIWVRAWVAARQHNTLQIGGRQKHKPASDSTYTL